MQNSNHPDDELLAAMAGGDLEAHADQALRDHVAHCAACRSMTEELSALQLALAELPDLAPPRPLRLLPPVAEPRSGGMRRWLRTLAGPAMAAGAGLVVVGAVGLYGLTGQLASGGAAPQEAMSSQDGRAGEGDSAATPPAADQSNPGVPNDEAEEGAAFGPFATLVDTDTPFPWLALALTGVALLAAGALLRFVILPRAG